MGNEEIVTCSGDGCSAEVEFIAPAHYCRQCWHKWWDCEDCTSDRDCELHRHEPDDTRRVASG